MQRSKLKAIAEQEAEEGQEMYKHEITEEMKTAVDRFIIEPSYIPILNLMIGRVSYGGMNPEVEKHMQTDVEIVEPVRKNEADVSDVEMARHFTSNLAQTMNKKFAGGKVTKRQLKKQKLKFLKPED